MISAQPPRITSYNVCYTKLLRKHKKALIIIDFGTATTFDAITENGEYLGGAICPGVMISSEALFHRASRLPRVEIFKAPERVIGDDTIESIKSGVIYGNAAMVDGMVDRMKQEMKTTSYNFV